MERSIKARAGFLKKIIKIDKCLPMLIKKKRERTQRK